MTRKIRCIAANLAAAALLLPMAASTQTLNQGYVNITLAADYDLDSASFRFPFTAGRYGKILSSEVPVERRVKNGAGTTDIKSIPATANSLDNVEVDDILIFHIPASVEAVVVTDTDANNVVISPAVDLSAFATLGVNYGLRNFTLGTGAESGAIEVSGFQDVAFHYQISQMVTDGTGATVQTQCRGIGINPIWNPIDTWVVPDASVPAARTVVIEPARYTHCRVAAKLTTADDGGDLTTNKEKFGARFVGYLGAK